MCPLTLAALPTWMQTEGSARFSRDGCSWGLEPSPPYPDVLLKRAHLPENDAMLEHARGIGVLHSVGSVMEVMSAKTCALFENHGPQGRRNVRMR